MEFIQKNKISIIAILVFVFLTFTEILLYNEETIVAFCFLVFVMLSYAPLSDMLASEFDDRYTKIFKQFDFSIGEKRLTLLLDYYPKLNLLVKKIIEIYIFSFEQKKSIIIKIHLALINNILVDLKQKLKTINIKQTNIVRQIQLEIITWFSQSIYNYYKLQSNVNISYAKLSNYIMIQKYINTTLQSKSKESINDLLILSEYLTSK